MSFTENIVINQAHKTFKNPTTDQNEPDFDENTYINKTLITQDCDELKAALAEKNINFNIEEFEPNGNWAFLNQHKFKFHWQQDYPKQINLNDQIYSIITNNFAIRSNKLNEMIITIKLADFPVVMCIFVPDIAVEINNIDDIKKRFTESSRLEKKRLLLSHLNTEKIFQPQIQQELSVNDHTLKLMYGIDFAKIIVNRHGIYINRQNRDKQQIDHNYTFHKDDLQVKLNYCCFWLENYQSGQILFTSF